MFLEGLRKATGSVRIACVPVEIRTEYFPNTNQERYRYVIPFGHYSGQTVTVRSYNSPE
jgi:hypothetical protein